ncbi:HPP family protein [Roseovarius sp. D0-M9]|uniref:HPP family protein n=1 Tax=Roseovarius sp. D0-M9 TaxID=3127117 RepID=UPI0030102BC6
MRPWHHLYPALPPFDYLEQLRAGVGALLGISLCALVVHLTSGLGGLPLYLVAPLGATAVLVFCVPNSPLAQPWSAIAGNTVAALTALVALRFAPEVWAAGIAVGGAIAVMMFVRALHPPGGAVALLIALDPAPALEAGPLFALTPIGVTTTILVLAAICYNRATGRAYPFRQTEPDDPAAHTPRLGLSNDQLLDLLERFNQSTNVGVADLGRLLAGAEAEAAQHRFDGTVCADIMTTDLITVRSGTPLTDASRLFRENAIKSLPVVDDDMRLQGIVFQADLLEPQASAGRTIIGKGRPPRRVVRDVMWPADQAVAHDVPVGTLLDRLAKHGSEVVPVTKEGQLVGILTRSDIIRLLLRGQVGRSAASR